RLTMSEGAVAEWLKSPGDHVLKGEPLFVVSTDKADMEVESLAEATPAEIVVERGRTVAVGTVIAYLERSGQEVAPMIPESESVAVPTAPQTLEGPVQKQAGVARPTTAAPAAVPETSRGRPLASPRARRLARELRVDLGRVRGSGVRGRIREADVRKSAESGQVPPSVLDVRRRRLIAERMVKSIQTIPHFSLSLEVNS